MMLIIIKNRIILEAVIKYLQRKKFREKSRKKHTREVSDMDESVVEGGIDVCHSEHEFALFHLQL